MILYSADAEADKVFLRDVLQLPNVDVGHGWLIFALPPSEIAVHPDQTSGKQEIYFTCDDIQAFVENMSSRGIACSDPQDQGWGILSNLTLPGGGKVGVYQP